MPWLHLQWLNPCGVHAGSLLKLTINGNQLRALAPECGQLTNLKELHLQGNQLAELPTELYQLSVSSPHTGIMLSTCANQMRCCF